jgi:hypothetical protein
LTIHCGIAESADWRSRIGALEQFVIAAIEECRNHPIGDYPMNRPIGNWQSTTESHGGRR